MLRLALAYWFICCGDWRCIGFLEHLFGFIESLPRMVMVDVALDACGFNLEGKDNETRLNIIAHGTKSAINRGNCLMKQSKSP